MWSPEKRIEIGISDRGFSVSSDAGTHRQAIAGKGWPDVLGLLETWMKERSIGGKRMFARSPSASICLSLDYCSFFSIPWSDAMASRRNAESAAASYFSMHFAATGAHGADDRQFSFLVDDTLPGRPRLVCAVDKNLLHAITDLGRRADVRIASIAPWNVLAVNRHRKALPANGWFAAVENGRIALTAFENGRATEISTARWRSATSDYPSTGLSDAGLWKNPLVSLERRTRLRRGASAGLPLMLIDASDRVSAINHADIASSTLSRFDDPSQLIENVGARAVLSAAVVAPGEAT